MAHISTPAAVPRVQHTALAEIIGATAKTTTANKEREDRT